MDVKIDESWKKILNNEFAKPYFETLTEFVRKEYKSQTIYPPAKLIFNAFDQCPFNQTKVVILGQDPYHGPGQAHGLCFSVNDGIDFPPSLRNIFKELQNDVGKEIPRSGNLTGWAKQGVLLLNATLTVRANQAGSHQNKGWEQFTDAVINKINEQKQHVVLFYGEITRLAKLNLSTKQTFGVEFRTSFAFICQPGIFGNRHFSRANEFLKLYNLEPVQW
jgi:uracil-DNA glycosylase